MKRTINFFKIIFLTNLPYNCTVKEPDNACNETYQSLKNLKKQTSIQIEDNNDRQTRNFDNFKNDFQGQINNLKKQLEEQTTTNNKLQNNTKTQFKNELEEQAQKLAELQNEIIEKIDKNVWDKNIKNFEEQLNNQRNIFNDKMTEIENNFKLDKERIMKNIVETSKDLRNEQKEILNEKLNNINQQFEDYKNKLVKIASILNCQKKQLEEQEKTLKNIQSLNDTIKNLKEEITKQNILVTNLKNILTALQNNINQ